MLIILLFGRLLFLLTMSMVNEDVLWLEQLFIHTNISMLESTFGHEMASSSSSLTYSNNISSSSFSSSPSMSIMNVSAASIGAIAASQSHSIVLKWSVRIIGGLLIVIGGIGNTLSALTLSRKKMRAQVTSIYLIVLALSDLGNVFFSVLNFYIIRLDPDQNMRLYSNIVCKLHMFFTYYFINLSPTILVAVSVQRYLAIAKHHYSKRHCTVKNAYMIIGIIGVISFLIQLHWGIFYELLSIPDKQRVVFNQTIYRSVCSISEKYSTYLWFRSKMLGYIQWFFFTLCPFVIMLILNSMILRVIASARRIQQRINQKNQRKKAKQRNMTIMLLSVSCVFILLTAPASTFMAFGHLFKDPHGPKSQSLWTMFSLIYYANTAANFLLYFLTADVFRQELRVMFLSLPCCSKILPERTNGIVRGGTFIGRKTGTSTMPALTSPGPGDGEHQNDGTKRVSTAEFRKRNGTNLSVANSNICPNDHLLVVTNYVHSSLGASCNDDSPF